MTAYLRFRQSMELSLDAWREGSGYDLAALAEATPLERVQIESLLLGRAVRDWRDVEALVALATPVALAKLRDSLDGADAGVRMAIERHCPALVDDEQRTAIVVRALETAVFYGGLSQALDQVETWHPPAVIEALLRGLLQREGEVACHYAAMLYFLHGRAATPFDIEQREFFWRFNSGDREQRVAALRELCAAIGRDPEAILRHLASAPCSPPVPGG